MKFLFTLVSGVFFGALVSLTNDEPKTTQLWIALGAALFTIGSVSCFRLSVIVTDSGMSIRDVLSVRYKDYRWEDIKAIKAREFGGPEGISSRVFQIVPRNSSQRYASIVPFIKNYKQLLRDILNRVPDDIEIDTEVVRVSRWPDSPEGRQRLSEIRSRASTKPTA